VGDRVGDGAGSGVGDTVGFGEGGSVFSLLGSGTGAVRLVGIAVGVSESNIVSRVGTDVGSIVGATPSVTSSDLRTASSNMVIIVSSDGLSTTGTASRTLMKAIARIKMKIGEKRRIW